MRSIPSDVVWLSAYLTALHATAASIPDELGPLTSRVPDDARIFANLALAHYEQSNLKEPE